MALTIPTPEGPFESIAFLGDRMDWPTWLDDVTTISKALDIWKYVNPDSKDRLSEPVKPNIPTRPKLKNFPTREQYETDRVYDLRVEQERHTQSLSMREYDILYEQYRMDTARYLTGLATYTAAKDDLQKLFRIIYRSLPKRYCAYLTMDAAETPRAMVQSLRRRIQPIPDKDRAPIAQRQFDVKLNAQPTDDKQDFIEAIALAAVELHRLKGSAFDESTAVKDLIRALQTLDKPFVDAWSRKFGGSSGPTAGSVLDIVEEFKYKMRMQDDKPYLKELSNAAPVPDQAPPAANFVELESSIPFGNDTFNAPVPDYAVQQNGVEPTKKAKKAKAAKAEAVLAEQQQPKSKKAAREISFNEKPSKPEKPYKPTWDDLVEDPSATNWDTPDFTPPEKPAKSKKEKKESAANEKKFKSKNAAPDAPVFEKPAKSKKKPEWDPNLVMRNCPGCQLKHLIRDDAWWENCFVYYELMGLGNIPDHFTISPRKLDLAYSRLEDCPDEFSRSQAWASKQAKVNGVKQAKQVKEVTPVKPVEEEEFNLW